MIFAGAYTPVNPRGFPQLRSTAPRFSSYGTQFLIIAAPRISSSSTQILIIHVEKCQNSDKLLSKAHVGITSAYKLSLQQQM